MKRYLQSKKESGATLIVGLIFLVVMSVIGLSAMSNVSVQEQINGNSTSKNRALQSAETALLNAEKDTLVTPFLYPDYLLSVVDDPTLALSDADLLEATNWQPCNDLLRSPKQRCRWPEGNDGPMVKYEYIDEADDVFRITVRVIGQGNSVVMLQSVYKR